MEKLHNGAPRVHVKRARACSLINAKHMHPFSFAEYRRRFSDEKRTGKEHCSLLALLRERGLTFRLSTLLFSRRAVEEIKTR